MTQPYPYEELLELARAELSTPPPEPSPDQFERAMKRARHAARLRRALARVALTSAIAVWLASVLLHPIDAPLCPGLRARDVLDMGLMPALGALVCIAVVGRRHIAAQIFVRACCWSYLGLGTMSTLGSPGLLPWAFPALAVSAGAVLLVLGDHGLERERYLGVFVPLAHRRALTWTMILAMADLQTLLVVNQANLWMHPLTAACTVAMLVAVTGLYALRAWGLWLNLGLNLLIAGLASTGLLGGVPGPLAGLLAATAALQALLVVPLVRRILRGSSAEGDAEPRHWRRLPGSVALSRAVVVLLIAATIAIALRGPEPARLAAYCAEQHFEPG